MKRLGALLLVLALLAPLPQPARQAAAAAAEEQESYEPLSYGAQGEVVSEIQRQLSALGYYTGKISGNFLDGTRAAVTRFQKDYGLEETGIVDGETEAMLLNAEYRTLSYGSEGEDVKRVQEHLEALEYFSGRITGKYLEATTASVRSFQERNGLDATGEADVQTQKVLFSSSAVAKSAPEPQGTPEPDLDMGDINDVVMVEDGQNNDLSLENAEYGQKLRRGTKGTEVKQVQQRLTDLGYFDGPISGNYMDQTMDAVKRFQEINGLKADGITGQDTWSVLFSAAEALNASATPRPTPIPTPVPYAVTVDVQNQAIIVYERDEAGEFTVPIRKMVCSTGKVGTDSDLGEWLLDGRKARWAYFSLYGSHAQYWTRINSNIAFHSVIYTEVDYMKLNVRSYNMLGSRASHGCIRLLVSEAKWIYENIEDGVVVTIRDDLPADQELRMMLKPPALNKKNMLPVSTPEPTPEPDYQSDGQPPQPFRRLKKGSSGEDVYWLQRKLQELGYYTGTITGGYYTGTHNAVKAFQKDHGIKADGIAGEKTLLAIYADVLESPAPESTETAAGTPAPSGTAEALYTLTPEITKTPGATVTATPAPTVTPTPAPTGQK